MKDFTYVQTMKQLFIFANMLSSGFPYALATLVRPGKIAMVFEFLDI
jgi:hypothetical protein